MSKFKNRLILIDGMIGNGYSDSFCFMKDFYNINNIDSLLSKIESEDNGLIKNRNICYFLCKQKEELIDVIKNNVLSNKNLYSEYLSSLSFQEYILFDNLNEINIFKKAITSKSCMFSDKFVYAFRQGLSFDKVSLAIDFFQRNEIGFGRYSCKVSILYDEIDGFINNANIWDFPDESIINIILNVNEIGIYFDNLTKEELNVLVNHNSIYVSKINKENLDIIDKIASIISNGPDDKDEDNVFYGYGSIGDAFKEQIYNFRQNISDCIDTIISKYEDREIQRELVTSVLGAIEYGFVCSEDDINLLNNKIKYGFNPEDSVDIGLDFAGISKEFYYDLDIRPGSIAKIIKLKKELPKGFFKKTISSVELAKRVFSIDANIFVSISNLLELGQLNMEQIVELISNIRTNTSSFARFIEDFSNIEYKVSFDEVMYIYQNRKFISVDAINSLKTMKHASRFLKLKSIVEINKTLDNKDFCIDYSIIEKYISDKDIVDLMKKDNPFNIADMGDYIEYKAINSIVPIDNISTLNKIKLLLRNNYNISDLKGLSLESIDSKVWDTTDLKALVLRMKLSDAFISEHRDNIIAFLSSEEYNLVNSYYSNPYSGVKQKTGIMLIGKSIIANKYKDLKFVKEDIKKEISIDISDEAFNVWKRTDTLSRNSYTVQDSSDFKCIMKMGEIPVRSCMNYINGMYSNCLLSNFDTAKKMILIHKNGKYVGRAILRLTVMSDTDNNVSSLEFVDVDNISKNVESSSSNKLIVFLEKAYTTLDSQDFKECYDMIIELLKGKAEEMGAQLVTSYNYTGFVDDNCKEQSKYVFITASKNGSQYLDSFDGSTSTSYCYKRGRVHVY